MNDVVAPHVRLGQFDAASHAMIVVPSFPIRTIGFANQCDPSKEWQVVQVFEPPVFGHSGILANLGAAFHPWATVCFRPIGDVLLSPFEAFASVVQRP